MTLTDLIIYGTHAELKQALEKIEDVNYLDEYGYTPLIETAVINDTQKAKLLLEKADVNQRDITKRSALHWAVSNDNVELCQLLLEKGADANAYSFSSEPVLAKAVLRNHQEIKNLLTTHGADYTFAYDYIQTKLIGHSFELIGSVDIVDTQSVFAEVDYEGFYLEFCLDLIGFSLENFQRNYAARTIRPWFITLKTIIAALKNAQKLLKYDHYLLKKNFTLDKIQAYIDHEALIIPISQEAHAISLVKCGSLLAICDRAEGNHLLPIYYMNRPSKLDAALIANLMYQKHSLEALTQILQTTLSMQKVDEIPLSAQVIGNCSWANTEATIPVLAYLLALNNPHNFADKADKMTDSLELFQRWRDWHMQRSLDFLIKNFKLASPARKAFIVALLAAILFQTCSAENLAHVARAKQIIPILKTKEYAYVLESYLEFYSKRKKTAAGENLKALLKKYQIENEI